MTGGPAFALQGLTKRFGRVTAVDGVSVEVARGEVVALLGPNGAGKSTTVDMLLGLTKPDAGGVDRRRGSPREAVGPGARRRHDAERRAAAGCHRRRDRRPDRLDARQAAARRGGDRAGRLENLVKRRCGKLSGGERQRVRFALALAGDPQVLVLDEPTAAMDVDGRRAFWAAIREFAATGRTVLFATHYLAEAEDYADRVVLMRHGVVVADGPVAEVRAAVSGRVLKAAVPDATEADLARLPGVTAVQLRAGRAELACADSDAAIRALLAEYPQRVRHRNHRAGPRRGLPGAHRRRDRRGGRVNTTYLSLEIKRIVRSPQFTIFTIGMPMAMYLLFGSIFGDTVLDNGLHSSTQTMITMAAYGASGGALFTGTRVAQERTDGWQRQLRLTPMRGPGYLVGEGRLGDGGGAAGARWWCSSPASCGRAAGLADWGRLLVFAVGGHAAVRRARAWPSACSARATRSAR